MGTTAEKLNYAINATNDIAEGINNIGGNITQNTELADFREELDILYKQMPKVSQDGTSVSLAGTRKGKLEITPKGNTEQEKTNGYQCIVYPFVETTKTVNGLTFTDLGDGTVKVNGTSTANTDFILNTYNFVQGETYTIIDELTDNNYGKYTIMIPSYTSWGRNIYIGLNDGKYETFQADTSLQLRIQITIYANNTLNNVIFKPMLYKGSYDSSKEWEKYTNEKESPSPDYPQDIKVVTGENAVKISGSNLVNENNLTGITNIDNITNKIVTSNSLTNTGSAGCNVGFPELNIETGNYYISADIRLKSGTVNSLRSIQIWTRSSWTVSASWVNNPSLSDEFQRYVIKYTVNNIGDISNTIYSFYTQLANPNNAVLEIKNIQISKTNVTYEPYIEPIEKELNLGNIELAKINDYSDLIFKNEITNPYYDNTLIENAWYKKQNIIKIDSYNLEPITTDYISTTGELSIGATIYYIADSPIDVLITDTTLINQLEELNKIIGQGGTVVIETESEEENAQLIVNASALKSFENT